MATYEIQIGFRNCFITQSLQSGHEDPDSDFHKSPIPEVLKEYAYILQEFVADELGLREWDIEVLWDGGNSEWRVYAERQLPGGSGLRKRFERVAVETALVWKRDDRRYAWQLGASALRALAKDILLLAEFSGKQVVVPEWLLNDVDEASGEYQWVCK